MTKPKKTPEQLAKEHWEWLESILQKTFKDAFVHGYNHGQRGKK